MNLKQVMKELEANGSAQTRKTYRRHGATGDMFGVSYAVLGKLRKRIGLNQELAEELWATENLDARTLATMVADPAKIKVRTLDAWARSAGNRGTAAAISNLAAEAPSARKQMEKWTKARSEMVACAGWHVLASLAREDADLPEPLFEERLAQIEASIHDAKNWVKYAMNNALISIGVRNSRLEKKAIAAARRIGVVEVDHGDTSCKTPDAAASIKKAVAHKKAKRARKEARATR